MMIANKPSELTDVELVEQAQQRGSRDERPFRELMERHQRMVWRVCYNFMGNAEDAEDITQDVFLKAYRNLEKFEGRASFKTWIYRIAINSCQNELRRRARRPQVSTTPLDVAAEFLPSAEDVELQNEQQNRLETLRHALDALREEDRDILLLKDFHNLQYNEIAEQKRISLSAAKMRVQRARHALNILYKQLSEES